jgi:hypothetical protein
MWVMISRRVGIAQAVAAQAPPQLTTPTTVRSGCVNQGPDRPISARNLYLTIPLGVVRWGALIKPLAKRPRSVGQPPLSEDFLRHSPHWSTSGADVSTALHQPKLEALCRGVFLDSALEQVALEGHTDGIGRGIPFAPLPASLRGIQCGQQLATKFGGSERWHCFSIQWDLTSVGGRKHVNGLGAR